MTEYATDEEQIAALKKWWANNAMPIIAGLVLGVGGLVGWSFYQTYTHDRALASSEIYYTLESALENNDGPTADASLITLSSKYSSTPYLALGKLAIARMHVDKGDLDQAEQLLQWVISNAKEEDSSTLARLRFAEVLNAKGQYEAALSMLANGIPAAYTSLVEEYRGDAYVGMGKNSEAQSAYDRALISAGAKADFLQWKRDALGDATGASAS